MANTTYKASTRRGGKAGPNAKRISITVPTVEYEAVRALADRQHLTVGGCAANLMSAGLKVATEDANG